ncbi:hypothetical protein K1719_030694 [Acacia pycnantha]|nr:hypothetical protein K1719_030694 [Acacia pycnantha]
MIIPSPHHPPGKFLDPWKVRISIFFLSGFINVSRRNNTLNRYLFDFFNPKVSANPNPIDGIKSSNLIVGPSRKFLDLDGDVMPKVADVSRCFLAGESSGANLAHHMGSGFPRGAPTGENINKIF